MSAPAPVLERNLAALLRRCYVPALPEAAFRGRARAACLAAVGAASAAAPPAASATESVAASERSHAGGHGPQRAPARAPLLRWRPALAAAALLLGTVTALWWLLDADASDARRQAILAQGEVAARFAPGARWQAFGLQDDESPDGDTVRLPWSGDYLEAATPASLGLHVPGAAGDVVLQPDTAAVLRAGPAGDVARGVAHGVELQHGALSVATEAGVAQPAAGWQLRTSHGEVALAQGTLSARLLQAPLGALGGAARLEGVRLLLAESGVPGTRAAAEAAGHALPVGRAMLLVHGELHEPPESAETPSPGLPDLPRPAEPLPPAHEAPPAVEAAADEAGETLAAAPAPRLLQGRVTLAGEPVASYRLVLVPQEVPPRHDPEVLAVSAPDGRFAWADVPPGDYALYVLAEGRPAWSLRALAVTATEPLAPVDVALAAEGAVVTGFVVDALTEQPMAGVLVLSETDMPARLLSVQGEFGVDEDELPAELTARTLTDASGAFRLEHLSAGTQHLRVSAAGYGPEWSGELVVEEGGSQSGLLFRMAPGASVAGRVIGGDGLPWRQAIIIGSPEETRAHPCHTYAMALADDDGRYVMQDLPPGSGVAILLGDPTTMEAGSFAPRVQQWAAGSGRTGQADFLLAPERTAQGAPAPEGGRLHGRALAADGTPAANLMVSVAPVTGAEASGLGWRGALSGQDGAYAFDGLAPGRWEVYLGAGDGMYFTRIAVLEMPARGDLEQDFLLADGELAGEVVAGGDGVPVPEAVVILEQHTDATGAWVFAGRHVTAGDGRFRLPFLREGRYRLTAYDSRGAFGQEVGPDVHLVPGSVPEPQRLVLAPGGALVVEVRDQGGAPVRDAVVELTDAEGRVVGFSMLAQTDVEGRYRVQGMKPGLWYVEVTPPPDAGLLPRALSVQVPEGKAGPPLEFTLPAQP